MYPLPSGTFLGHLGLLEVYAYYDGPRLFAARSETGALFLGYWTGEEEDGSESWFYVAVSRKRLKYIRSGAITLRDAFLACEEGIVIKVTTSPDGSATTEAIGADAVPEDWLPPADERLSFVTETLPQLRGTPAKLARQSNREIIAVRLTPFGATRSEASAGLVSGALGSFQQTVQALGFQLEAAPGEPPTVTKRKEIDEQTRLVAMGFFGGSFGVLLGSETNPDLFGESLVGDALQRFSTILEARTDQGALRQMLTPMVAVKYREFLGRLAQGHSGLSIDWASVKPKRAYQADLNYREIERLAAVMARTTEKVTRQFPVRCRLVGANTRIKTYEVADTRDGTQYSGKVAPEAMADVSNAVLGGTYTATLRESAEEHETTPEQTVKRMLIGLKPD
jgi:hypothetical protein